MNPRLGWYGDDFTGATDTLASLAESGLRTLLFLKLPTPAQRAAAGPLDAIGLAGATRAMAPDAMAAELVAAGHFFATTGIDILHYKCCSTFDSAPHVGSIGAAVRTLRRHFGNDLLPIVGGQPNLGRYCLFGTLFAAAGGDVIHRIDRHPTMKAHPVTPMAEADLRLHLAGQGLERIQSLDYRAYEAPDIDEALGSRLAERPDAVLMDVSRLADLPIIGRLIWRHAAAAPLLAVGPSGVAQALAAAWPVMRQAGTAPPRPRTRCWGPVLALVGSLSPVTRAQAERASRYTTIAIDAGRLRAEPGHAETLKRQACKALAAGENVMLITRRPVGAAAGARGIAHATAMLLGAIMEAASIARLVIAGGDTASLAVKALDIWGLSYREPLVPGAPLCAAHSDDARLDGLEIVLKGGQMGPQSFFEDIAEGAC
jgi:uncharacterized protein YgbK (DUF1537 family)